MSGTIDEEAPRAPVKPRARRKPLMDMPLKIVVQAETPEPKPKPARTPKARNLTEIRSAARSHTKTAISVLAGVMCSEDATPAARVSAANAILDRGWGKVEQPIANDEGGVLDLIHRIERVIVRPGETRDGDGGQDA